MTADPAPSPADDPGPRSTGDPEGADLEGVGPEGAGTGGWAFWTGLAAGWAVMAYAVCGAVAEADATNPPALARWVVGALLVHDLVVAPIATAVAVGLARWAPPWWGRPAAWALASTALLVVFAYPLLRAFGRRAANPSILPRDYGTNLAVLVVAVWAGALAVIGYRAVTGRRSG